MVGENIKKLRLKHRFTQQELADHLGVSRQALGLYEKEKREPGIDMLIKLADTFNVTVDYLIGKNKKD